MIKTRKKNRQRQSTSRNKRILTAYSSQAFLQPLPSSKAPSVPLKKNHKASQHHNTSTNKHQKSRDKPHRKVHPKPKPTQSYQRIPMHQVHSNSNSRIQFSNATSGLERPGHPRHQLRINCSQETIMQQIWHGARDDVREREESVASVEQVVAATKIQKVFRGYITRKVFLRHIDKLEEQLMRQKEKLERKMSYKSYQFQENHHSTNSKQDFFPSNRKSPYKEPGIEYESVPMEREIERSSLTLNESSIAHQPQDNSMSFGQEPQPSPHFFIPPPKRSYQDSPQNTKIRHYVSQDGTRDGLSQNISNSASYSKPAEREAYSHFSSRMQEQSYATERQDAPIEKLRSAEKAKWEQVIDLVNRQLGQEINHNSTKEVMSVLLDFSLRNREELSRKDQATVTPTTTTHRQQPQISQRQPEQVEQSKGGQKINCFKKKSWKEATLQLQKIQAQENPLLSSQSLPQRTQTMRQQFLKTMTIEDQHLDRLINLRQSVLRQKQSASLEELNQLLQSNHLSQDEFLGRLTRLTAQFADQKSRIEQTREQIYQGYRAQIQLYKCTILDAKTMGIDVPFCRSMQIFPRHAQWRFDQVMIDELEQLANRKNSQWQRSRQISAAEVEAHEDKVGFECLGVLEPEKEENFEEDSDSSNPFQYTDGETDIYTRHSPSTFDLSALRQTDPPVNKSNFSINRYAPISISDFNQAQLEEDEVNGKDQEEEDKDSSGESENRPLRIETFQIESESEEQEVLYREDTQSTNKLTDWLVTYLQWELIEEILLNQNMKKGFIRSPRLNIQPIGPSQLVEFMEHASHEMPDFSGLRVRLNQKMYPNVKELLISMREDDEDSSVEYYEIGQYEYIINQEISYSVIDSFIVKNDLNNLQKRGREVQRLSIQDKEQQMEWLGKKGRLQVAKMQERQQLKRKQGSELRAQIMKIELHMVLDSWNQHLIKYRQNTNGFSGIGLNQLTISLIERVTRPMLTGQEMKTMFETTKGQLIQTITSQILKDRLLKEYNDFVSNDSQWIFYVQEAMELAFDLLKAMEMELALEVIEEIYEINRVRDSKMTEEPTTRLLVAKQIMKEDEVKKVKHTYPTEQVDSLDDSFESRDSVSAEQSLRLRRKIEEMGYEYDPDDSFYD